jgi:hypothetical protein
MTFQPISDAFSCFSDINYELVDLDLDDDTDKEEKEDINEEDIKIEPQFIASKTSSFDLHKYTSHHYLQQPKLFHSLEILIPPPKLT